MFQFSCKDCTERKLGCHSTCEKYKQDRDRYSTIKHSAKADMPAKYYICDAIAKNIDSTNKKKMRRSRYKKIY